ncbi:hypothetical protein ACQPW1_34230 [Nocardia sp. CA-128927]|uniref:hypothetical protein n=1 Tax=Nocardia sp. CA-128927 TaxID=3239975 RepID=UPI003D9778D0
MVHETVGEEHHRAASAAAVGVLFDHLLTQLAGVLGQETWVAGDEAEYPDVGSLALTPWTVQVDGFSLTAKFGFALRYPLLRLFEVTSGILQGHALWFTPGPFVCAVDRGSKMREFCFAAADDPRTTESALDAEGDLRA